MQPPVMLISEVLSALAGRLGHTAPGDADDWVITLTSLLVMFTVGGVAVGLARRLTRRPAPELTVLLNQSAAFYSRWPEDRHATAPAGELMAEAARCQRIVELLERRAEANSGPASRGPIDGLNAWIALLHKRIHTRDGAPSGPAYA